MEFESGITHQAVNRASDQTGDDEYPLLLPWERGLHGLGEFDEMFTDPPDVHFGEVVIADFSFNEHGNEVEKVDQLHP